MFSLRVSLNTHGVCGTYAIFPTLEICPSVGGSSPRMAARREDFPHPAGPLIRVSSLTVVLNVTFLNAIDLFPLPQ